MQKHTITYREINGDLVQGGFVVDCSCGHRDYVGGTWNGLTARERAERFGAEHIAEAERVEAKITITTFYSDNAAPCSACGTTAKRYEVSQDQVGLVETFCYGCHRVSSFVIPPYTASTITSAARLSAVERDIAEERQRAEEARVEELERRIWTD